jgi:RNase P/RNase MRP subunit p29
MNLIEEIPFFSILAIGLVAFLIYIGFGLYRKLILPILMLEKTEKIRKKNFAKLEVVVWVIFFIAVFYYGLIKSPLIICALLLLISVAFFDFWRNYLSGIILKFGDYFQLGDSVTINGNTGRVVHFGNRTLRIVTAQGAEILIPYRLVDKEVKIKQKSTPKILFKSVEIDVATLPKEGLQNKIINALNSNPWIIISSPTEATLQGDKAVLNFYVANNLFYEKAKRRLDKELC